MCFSEAHKNSSSSSTVIETKPAGTKPAGTTPAETKPAEKKPVRNQVTSLEDVLAKRKAFVDAANPDAADDQLQSTAEEPAPRPQITATNAAAGEIPEPPGPAPKFEDLDQLIRKTKEKKAAQGKGKPTPPPKPKTLDTTRGTSSPSAHDAQADKRPAAAPVAFGSRADLQKQIDKLKKVERKPSDNGRTSPTPKQGIQ